MREERLTERIRNFNSNPYRRERQDPHRMIDSILNHLQQILNTRRGSAQIGEEYGVPDFTELLRSFPDSITDIERAIRYTIEKYEPRLQTVEVTFIPQEETKLSVSFQIKATLIIDKDRMVKFASYLGANGKVDLR